MARLVRKKIVFCCTSIVVALAVAGCGGAEARKAKHLQKGQTYLAAGNFEKARVEFRNALQIAPSDSEARYENGVVDEKLGNIREAANFYQGAIQSNADNVNARTRLARLYLFSGAPDQAMTLIKPSIDKHPDDAGLLTVRAAARIQLKDQAGALSDAERAVSIAPTNEDAISVLAGVYKSQGETDKARNLLEEAIGKSPASVELRLALAQLYAGTGQQPRVEALLVDLVRVQPGEKAHRLRLAQYYLTQNRNDDAEKTLRQAIQDLPAERELKTGLVQFLAARRSREAAEKELTTMIGANPKDYELKFLLVQFYEQGKEFAKAETVLKDVIAAAGLEGPGITARNRLAALRVQQNDSAGAEKLIAEVLAKNPRDNDALILRGDLALAHKDPKTAIADLRSVLRDQPNSIGVMRVLARAHLANGEPALAEETMRRALEGNPKDAGIRLDLAELLVKLGKPEQAKPIIDELVKQQPGNYQALQLQFNVAVASKDNSGAKAIADAMVALQPKQSVGYFYQGVVAEADKHLDEAIARYSTALEFAPEAIEPLQGLTRALVAANRTPEALKRLDATMAAFPHSAVAANFKGEVLMGSKRTADAVAAFRIAIERDPTWWQSYHGLASAQASSQDRDGAVATLQAGIAKMENPTPLQNDLATLYESSGQIDAAINVYEAILRRDPHMEFAANNLAMLLVTYRKDQPSLDRAKTLVQPFASAAQAEYLDTYGWVLYKRGEITPALSALQNALLKAPGSPAFQYHVGMALAAAGQSVAARDNLTRALKAGNHAAWAAEAKATLDRLAQPVPAT